MKSISELHHQAVALINKKAYIDAHPLLVSIVKQDPRHADAYFLLGIINMEIGQAEKAVKLIEKARGLDTDNEREYLVYLLKAHSLTRNRQQVERLEADFSQTPTHEPLMLDTVGVALSTVGMHREAMPYYQQAIDLDGDKESYHYNYGIAAKFLGQFDKARQAFEKAIELNPHYVKAYFALTELSEPASHLLPVLHDLLKQPRNVDEQLHLAHAIAKEYEKQSRYQDAFNILTEYKQRTFDKLKYDQAAEEKLFEALHTKAQIPLQGSGCQSNQAIFVVGMPRSGTTLMERILSSHSMVCSGEELHDFAIAVKACSTSSSPRLLDTNVLEQAYQSQWAKIGEHYIARTAALAKSCPRFVDKLPFNFLYLDLIRRALPNAKIICMLRNPLDTCIGNFRQLFSLQNPFTAYSLDLDRTAEYYARFHRWIHEFDSLGHPNFRIVSYEDLVSRPEAQIRSILDFCHLPWQAQCLQIENNQAPVSTASKVQVREPINARSVGRWRRYQPHTDKIQAFFDRQGISTS
ncbi:tetratricopeptide repeat-containing sulfotransferase family protein [Bowmanella dokdonensis]|uniref:Sulfotransferase n=1 Tax=Bowmanella dokdonensis TaxID=751969 RepID=A0A939IL25_9ALTE|nr:sulfotransferase [Bowmanella dokdonensis]MBN7823768.1 sulfotransferase [Bowmanella dokdonensis]